MTLKSPKRQRQVSTANVVPGKRKRSSREKSVEPDLIVHSQSAAPSHSMITEEVRQPFNKSLIYCSFGILFSPRLILMQWIVMMEVVGVLVV